MNTMNNMNNSSNVNLQATNQSFTNFKNNKVRNNESIIINNSQQQNLQLHILSKSSSDKMLLNGQNKDSKNNLSYRTK
jgi:hypothetical protein